MSWMAALLVVLLAVVVESGFRSQADSVSGVAALQDADGRRLMLVILDSLSPEDAEAMPQMRTMMRTGWSSEVEPCLDRLTKMCIDEALTGRQYFSLFGLLRNLGPLQSGLGPNLLRDARAAGRSVAMVTAGDLTSYDGDVDAQEIFKGGYSAPEMASLLDFAQSHDLVVYHYRWHDSISHRSRVGSKRYKRSLREMNGALGRLKRGLPADMDLMVLGDHGHTKDGRHLQGLDVPTVMAVRSPRVNSLQLQGRVPLTAARLLAGSIMGLHSPDSRWQPGWSEWMSPRVSADIRGAVTQKAPAPEAKGVGFLLPVVLLGFVVLAAWVAGPWVALGVATVGVLMGLGLEDLVAKVHNPKGGMPRFQEVSWIPIVAGGLIGLLARRRWRDAWSGALIASGLLMAVLLPINAHYGIIKNAANLMPALVIGSCTAWVFGRRWWWAVGLSAISVWAWVNLTWVRFVNLEVRTYKAFRWMAEQPELAQASVGLLAAVIAFIVLTDRWPVRLGWSLLAAAGPVVPLPDSARLGIFLLLCGVWLFRASVRPFYLVQGVAWSLPLLFAQDQQAGVLAVPLATSVVLFSLREVTDRDWRWRWTGGLAIMLGGFVGMGWTMAMNVSGIDFGFLIQFLPGDLHERLWWLVGLGTVVKIFVPVMLIAALAQRILGSPAAQLFVASSRVAALRVAVIALCVGGWLMAPESSAAGVKLASVVQAAFYWSMVGGMGALSWAGLERGRAKAA